MNSWSEEPAATERLREYVEHLSAYAESYGPTEKLSVEQRTARDVYAEVGAILADLFPPVASRVAELEGALTAMVYVHPCNCGDGIPVKSCARCRAVETIGFDPALAAAGEATDGE